MTVMVKKTDEAFEMRVGTIKDDTKDESGAPEDDENGAEPEVAPGGASSSKNTGKRSATSSATESASKAQKPDPGATGKRSARGASKSRK